MPLLFLLPGVVLLLLEGLQLQQPPVLQQLPVDAQRDPGALLVRVPPPDVRGAATHAERFGRGRSLRARHLLRSGDSGQ